MTTFAYTRVSTSDQTTENQHKVIVDGGFTVDKWYSEDGVSGSIEALDRPAFSDMMKEIKEGDTVIVTMLDRLGRCNEDVLHTINQFKKLSVKLRIMQFDGVDVFSTMGKLIVSVMAAIAEMERNLLIERTKAGMARTKAQGTKLGAPLVIDPAVMEELCTKRKEGYTLDALAKEYKIAKNTIDRNIKKWADKTKDYSVEFQSRAAQYALSSVTQ